MVLLWKLHLEGVEVLPHLGQVTTHVFSFSIYILTVEVTEPQSVVLMCVPLSARPRCEPWRRLSVFPRQRSHPVRPPAQPPAPPSSLAPSPASARPAPPATAAAPRSAPPSELLAYSHSPPAPWRAWRKEETQGEP